MTSPFFRLILSLLWAFRAKMLCVLLRVGIVLHERSLVHRNGDVLVDVEGHAGTLDLVDRAVDAADGDHFVTLLEAVTELVHLFLLLLLRTDHEKPHDHKDQHEHQDEGEAAAFLLPGSSFSLNADTTLYAVWKPDKEIVPTEAVLTLGTVKVCTGQEFTMELSMEKNPGLMFLSFTLDYDAASFEFLGAEDGLFTGWTVNTEKSTLLWDADGDRAENGVLLRLCFRAKEEARTGETAIALADLFATNYAEELLGIGSVPGTVAILPHTPGDVNGDGEVDGRDLVRLRKYLTGDTGEEAIEANTNVNGDDVIDILDLIRLRKYLAQEDVILE